ncbi:hypothetical protein [Natrinema gari]|uniref:Uncharacterized protein n=1 Tax=Natrinema gari JCM 14663 TaxID=1230459 RepID=L9Z5N8_9EURY|nr:hypothetical protein [Natrinema gari]ELY80982.1 hypothetical protein C486_07778 [Natrinema gari JCM 14663]
MSGEHDPAAVSDAERAVPHPIWAALARLRRDPALFGPFLLVGIVLSLADWLRRHDPLPAPERAGVGTNGLDIRLEFVGYPTGIGQTMRPLESLIGLEPGYLVWGLGLYGLVTLAVSAAGTVTMAHAMGRNVRLGAVCSLFGFVVATDLFHRLLGSVELLQSMGLWGILPLAIYCYLFVRLFVAPGLLVDGRSIQAALRGSLRRTAGRGWRLFGLVVAIGLVAWLLASLPLGTVLSSTLVAPVHAVAIVVVLERGRSHPPFR